MGAGLMIQSLVGLLNVDTGVDPENLLTFQMNLTDRQFPDDAEIRGIYDDLTERLRSAPGVVSAASSFSNPLTNPFSARLGDHAYAQVGKAAIAGLCELYWIEFTADISNA